MFVAIAPQVRADIEQLMVEYYTEQELRELLAFYRGDVGLKSLESVPRLAQVRMTTLQVLVNEEMSTVTEIVESVTEEAREQSNS